MKSAETGGGCGPGSDRGTENHSVVFRKSDGGIVVTHHDSRDAALETAAEIRAAFPWVPVSVVAGAVDAPDHT